MAQGALVKASPFSGNSEALTVSASDKFFVLLRWQDLRGAAASEAASFGCPGFIGQKAPLACLHKQMARLQQVFGLDVFREGGMSKT